MCESTSHFTRLSSTNRPMMSGVLICFVTVMLSCADTQSPVFLVNPVSVAAVDGTTVEFTCTANNTDTVTYRVNDTSAVIQSVISKGFIQLGSEEVDSLTTRRNLTATVSSLYNNTEIFCIALGSPMNVDSEIANLLVQGPLSHVCNLLSFTVDSSTVNISWSPPFTLPGTTITGYNISVTSNGTTTNYFTSNSYYVLQLSDSFSCNDTSITVSGYNGLDGETLSLNVCQSSGSSDVQSMKTSSMDSFSLSTKAVPSMTVTTSSIPDDDGTAKPLRSSDVQSMYTNSMDSFSLSTKAVPTMTVTTSSTPDADGTAKPLRSSVLQSMYTSSMESFPLSTKSVSTMTVTTSSTPDVDGAAKPLKAMSIAIAVSIGAVIFILLAAVLH